MSVIRLEDKTPRRHNYARLRMAVRRMGDALEQQHKSVATFQDDMRELKGVIDDIGLHLSQFENHLGNIRIDGLGKKSLEMGNIVKHAA